jgi:amidase
VTTFITRFDGTGDGIRLAVKDLIDMEGVPTTAGCPAVADTAERARHDAPCLAGARAAGARIVGKTNLHELAFGASGVNDHFGTPVNPLDPALVPGGSSSGSAVAVGSDEADVAFGSDTGGSVRIPSACCGTVGLKTTHGRVSLEGVWPLALSLDTIGPMAADVDRVIAGMQLLEPGFEPGATPPAIVGRFRPDGVDPAVDAAVDRLLAASELEVVEIDLPGWTAAQAASGIVLIAEAWQADRHLLDRRARLGVDVAERLELGRHITSDALDAAVKGCAAWRAELEEVLSRVELVALPTLSRFPPRVDALDDDIHLSTLTLPVNASGLPALAMPAPATGPLPASIQVVGPHNGEERLVAAGRVLEAAASSLA